MSHVSYNPQSSNRPFLPQAGIYGPGQENEAKVTVFSVALAEPGTPAAPFDDKQCEKDSYTVWNFQVIFNGSVVFARSRAQANTLENSGSKNMPWLNNLGVVPSGTDEQGFPTYDLDKVVGMQCSIRVGKPRQDKNDATVWYTGDVQDVFGVTS